MSDFRLKVNHLIIVPLVHPDGKRIILNNGNTVPVLAKVLHIHFNFIVVVNFFGYVHNVLPTSYEYVNPAINITFYTEMLNKAKDTLQQFSYSPLDNKTFYQNMNSSYTYLYPNMKDVYKYSDIPLMSEHRSYEPVDDFDTSDTSNGKIRVIVSENKLVLHKILETRRKIYFDESTGQLYIRGYGKFTIEDSYSYTQKHTKYVIFRSGNQFLHMRDQYIIYANIPETRNYSKKYEVKYRKEEEFGDIIKIINKNFNDV